MLLAVGCGYDTPSTPVENQATALARLQFTCGHDPFPFAALSGPVGAEQAATPQATALRALLAAPPEANRPNLPIVGYRLLAQSADSIQFAAVSDEFGTGLVYVRLELDAVGWTPKEWGGCRPTAVFNGLNAATWQLAPDVPFPNARSISFTALVSEAACTSGRTADDRVLPPAILTSQADVLVIFAVRPPPPSPNGLETCPGPPPTRFEVALPEPLGERTLLDGGVSPPADPHPPIAPFDVDPIH
jgi:hypothetical protein